MTQQYRSRLSRRQENKTKKTIIFSVIGIIAVLFGLYKFGLPLFVNLTFLVSGSRNSIQTEVSEKDSFISPPVLNPVPNATNSASILVSGIAREKQSINLYVNGSLVDKTITKGDGKFEFSEVTLSKETNTIRVKAVTENDKESGFSNEISITYKSQPPALSVDSPTDGQTFKKDDKQAQVKGKTDVGVKVTVNGFWAIVDSNGKFSYTLPLQDGENQIKVVATDEAGNTAEKSLKVTYSH